MYEPLVIFKTLWVLGVFIKFLKSLGTYKPSIFIILRRELQQLWETLYWTTQYLSLLEILIDSEVWFSTIECTRELLNKVEEYWTIDESLTTKILSGVIIINVVVAIVFVNVIVATCTNNCTFLW